MKRLSYIFSVVLVILMVLSFSTNVFAEETKPQTESMVKSISLENGKLTTEFKPSNHNYSAYFDDFDEHIKVNVELNNSRFEYILSGNSYLDRYADNIIVVTVTDPNGEYEDEKYTFNVFFNTTGLTYLDVEKGIFSPQFDKFHTTYYVILENDIDTFDAAGVNWKTANDDAVVEVECITELNEDGTLPEGKRTDFRLKVIETDKSSKNYKLRLYRKASMISAIDENALLSSIKINDGTIEIPTFKQNKAFYDVTVPKSIDELKIQAYPEDRSNIAEVIGSTVMNETEPTYITIKVTSNKFGTSSYYTLRCQYDTMMHTQKHTDFQMYTYVAISIFIGFIIGAIATLLVNKKNKHKCDYNYYNGKGGTQEIEQTQSN